jgi:hypothetical protein
MHCGAPQHFLRACSKGEPVRNKYSLLGARSIRQSGDSSSDREAKGGVARISGPVLLGGVGFVDFWSEIVNHTG